MSYLAVRNWERYQHYKDRNPPWIKFYVATLEDEDLRGLSVSSRLLANLMLCVAAKRDNVIPENPAWIGEEVGLPARVVAKALAELLAISFLVRKQKRTQNAMPRDRDREQSQTVIRNGYVLPEPIRSKLLNALKDKNSGTANTIDRIAARYRLAEGDFAWALECASGPGVVSPSAVAVAELKKRGEAKRAA